MSWYGDIWETVTSPAKTIVNTLKDTVQGAWEDFNGITSAKKSAEAADKNTQAQLAWERERATNAHQWEVQDLEKAGLNKILTANGSGAVTSSITPQMPDTSNYGQGIRTLLPTLMSTITSAMTANKQLKQEKDLTEKKLDIEAKSAEASNALKIAQAKAINNENKPGGYKDLLKQEIREKINLTRAQTHYSTVEARYKASQTIKTITDIAAEEIEIEIRKKDLDWYTVDKITNYVGKYVIPTVMTAYGAYATKKTIEKVTKKGIQNYIKTTKTNPNYIIKNKNGKYINLKTGEIFE